MNWDFTLPVSIRFGNGRIAELGTEIRNLGGSRGILITSRSFEKRGIVSKLMDDCCGLIVCFYSGISPNPDMTECQDCIDMIKENNCDFIVAVGGGSVIDCAKAASGICLEDHTVAEYMDDFSNPPMKHIPLIAVPTTSGTSAEITTVSVISDHTRGLKKPLYSPAFVADVAIVDPELTYSVPRYVTACTGMDVFCHAVESYWSTKTQPTTEMCSAYAIGLVMRNLRQACDAPDDPVARENMAVASVIAGMAFRPTGTSSPHACSYPLTNIYGFPHGEGCALTVEHFMRENAKHDGGHMDALAHQLGYKDTDEFCDEVTALKKHIGLRTDLKEFNLDDEKIDELAEICIGYKHHQVNHYTVTLEELRDFFASLK